MCCQDSITIDPNDHLQELQLLRYGSDEWIAVFRTDRNTIESANDKMKSDFALDLNTERCMRGLAATQLVFAFKVASLNHKRIADHARDQLRKEERAKRQTGVTPVRDDLNPTLPNTTNLSSPLCTPPRRRHPSRKRSEAETATAGPTTGATRRRSSASPSSPNVRNRQTRPETARAPSDRWGLLTVGLFASSNRSIRKEPLGGTGGI